MIELDHKKFYATCIVIVIMFGMLVFLWYKKADEVTRDPCSICAMRQGKDTTCTIEGIGSLTYLKNGSSSYKDFQDVGLLYVNKS